MDIMQEEGSAKFLAVVEEIKQMPVVTTFGTSLCILLFHLPLHHSRGGVTCFIPVSWSVASPSVSIIDGEIHITEVGDQPVYYSFQLPFHLM